MVSNPVGPGVRGEIVCVPENELASKPFRRSDVQGKVVLAFRGDVPFF